MSLVFALIATSAVRADPAKTDLHGIALGMIADQAAAAAALPYSSDIACKDAIDDSDHNASVSAGDPSVVHSFCSHETPLAIRDRMLQQFGRPANGVEADPNGFDLNIDATTEAVLSADDGTYSAGRGKQHVLSLRGNAPITTESNPAVERAKKALR